MNPGKAVAGVFFEPGKTFDALIAHPTWWFVFGRTAALTIRMIG